MLIETKLPPDFSFKECLWFLHRGLDDIMHRVVGTSIYKAIRLGEDTLILEITANGDKLQIMTQSSESRRTDILSYVERWFDLRRDLQPFYRLLDEDKDLAILKEKYKGLHLIGIPDLFETLCWCVMGQQINLDFAYRIKRRLVEKYGTLVTETPCELYLFPTPERLAEVTTEQLRALQLTTRKAEYIKGIAGAFLDGTISEVEFRTLPEEEAKQRLLQHRGIGPWTAHYTAMKALGGMNCWPAGDSGINRALFQLKGIVASKEVRKAQAVFKQFEGWQSYLCYYLWRTQREPE